MKGGISSYLRDHFLNHNIFLTTRSHPKNSNSGCLLFQIHLMPFWFHCKELRNRNTYTGNSWPHWSIILTLKISSNLVFKCNSRLKTSKGFIWNCIRLLYNRYCHNHIVGVMVSMLASSVVDREIELRSDQTKDYEIGICCFSAKQAELRRKSKDWLARNQDNVSKWGDMSTRGLLFQ